jgi:hypothetical protein
VFSVLCSISLYPIHRTRLRFHHCIVECTIQTLCVGMSSVGFCVSSGLRGCADRLATFHIFRFSELLNRPPMLIDTFATRLSAQALRIPHISMGEHDYASKLLLIGLSANFGESQESDLHLRNFR